METLKRRNRLRLSLIASLVCSGIIAGTLIRLPSAIGIPITFQVPMIQLAALGLPAPYGLLAVTLYLTLGAFGFPVFAQGGGISYFFEKTGGYLIGFWFATLCCQMFHHLIVRHQITIIAALILHTIIIYLFGITGHCLVDNLPWMNVAGVTLSFFLPGLIPNLILAYIIIITFRTTLQRKFNFEF